MSQTPRNPDREWLGYDHSATETSATGPAERASSSTDDVAASPWLRHDLGADSVPDDHGSSSDPERPSSAPGRDPAWLAPELDVPSESADDDLPHDTGVPPTLAEEPSTVQPSEAAGGAAPDAPELGTGAVGGAHGPAGEASPRPGVGDGHDAGDGRDGRDGRGARDSDEERGAEEEAGVLAVMGAAVKEFAIVVGMALVLSFIVKTWLLQAFYIPSGSMEDTLVLNDRVIVSKLTPGPIDLKRGDIIVFADPGQWLEATPAVPHSKLVTAVRETMTFIGLLPDNSENHLIKRVIGLPGDHVVCCDEGGRITVNGVAIKEPYLKPGDSASDQDFDINVPRGRVWVMGDHRSNSADSRAHDGPANDGAQGSVDERLIVGRAVALVWPLDHLTWLSNPTQTFAKVPAPKSSGDPAPADVPQGDPGSSTGGVEVTGDGEGGG